MTWTVFHYKFLVFLNFEYENLKLKVPFAENLLLEMDTNHVKNEVLLLPEKQKINIIVKHFPLFSESKVQKYFKLRTDSEDTWIWILLNNHYLVTNIKEYIYRSITKYI